MLRDNPSSFQSFCSVVVQSSELQGATLQAHEALVSGACACFIASHVSTSTYLLCYSDVPFFLACIHVIKMLLNLEPKAVSHLDCMPLKSPQLVIATGTCASMPVINFLLLESCPAALNIQDVVGKTPLHPVCDSSCILVNDVLQNSFEQR